MEVALGYINTRCNEFVTTVYCIIAQSSELHALYAK